MSTKERILAIRLMKKLQTYPETAKALGIEVRDQKLFAIILDKEKE